MAGMFYSLEEVAQKLNKSTDEVKEIVRQGRLREFREGIKPLFKADEVEALMSDTSITPSAQPPAPSEQKPEEEEISLTPEPTIMPEPTGVPPVAETPEPTELLDLIETPEAAEIPEPTEVPMPPEAAVPIEVPELIETPEVAEIPEPTEVPMPPEAAVPIESPQPIEQEPVVTPESTDMPDLSETPLMPDTFGPFETPEPVESPEGAVTPEPIEVPELIDTPEPAELSDLGKTSMEEGDLSAADTAIAGSGIDVFDETGSRVQSTDDTVIEAKDTTAETTLQEIEEDVNLDSFGSGSGLLDLSLQADDTSLGGILDEIYAPEAVGEEQAPVEEASSAVEMAAEAEHILPEEELTAPEPAAVAPIMTQAYAEPEPDTVSKALGLMLILPLLAIVYTAVVAETGFRDIMPAIREKVQGIIWPIVGGTAFVAVLIVVVGFMLGGKGAKPAKKKKAKKGKEAPPPAEEVTA